MRIAIASGKGGTGKTTVAVNLAIAIGRAQIVDCDVEDPNVHLFFDAEYGPSEEVCLPVPKIDQDACNRCRECAKFCQYNALAIFPKEAMVFPELCHGCGGCTTLCPEKAITEVPRRLGIVEVAGIGDLQLVRGWVDVGEPKAVPVVEAVKAKMADQGPVIIDSPPGAACPAVASIHGADYCILVTEPTPFGLYDLDIAVEVCRKLKVPFGVLVNREGVGDDRVDRYCEKEGIDLLMKIPQSMEIARLYSSGKPFLNQIPGWSERFKSLYRKIEEVVG
jgi:MinD superfamily P-loop ATPase